MTLFSSGYRITQKYGNNPAYYGQFGFAGHEGLDAVPADISKSWDVLTPETIEIVRDFDVTSGAYGIYVVGICWETKRSWWFCHLEKNYCKVGDVIEAGKPIGKMGNTGNSSGAHLHLGVRECDSAGNPINLNNGYKGFIDPLPILENKPMTTTELEACMADRAKFWKERDEALADVAELQQREKELEGELEEAQEKVSTQVQEIADLDGKNKSLVEQVNKQTIVISELKKEIADLKLQLSALPTSPDMTPTIANVVSLFRLWLKGWLK